MSEGETLKRVACLGPDGVEIPIYLGPNPSRCKWIVICKCPFGPPAEPISYVVTFLDPQGKEIDFSVRDTLQEAIDTGAGLSAVKNLRWVSCEVAREGSQEFDLEELRGIWDSR